jgi:hypothetical protein
VHSRVFTTLDAVTLSNLRVDGQGMTSVDISIKDCNVSGTLKLDTAV